MLPGLFEAGATVLGGGLNYLGVKDTNQTNRGIANARNLMEVEEARKARDFSASQAGINRDFEERMSSTAVQRRFADLKKAGINPMLAAEMGASSPAGSVGPTAKANAHGYTAQNELSAMLDKLSTAIDLKKRYHESEKAESEARFSSNKADISTPMSAIAKDAETGWSNIKKFAGHMGESAAKVKMRIDSIIDDASSKVKMYKLKAREAIKSRELKQRSRYPKINVPKGSTNFYMR